MTPRALPPHEVARLLQQVLEAAGIDAAVEAGDRRQLLTARSVAELLDCTVRVARERMAAGWFGPVLTTLDKHPRVERAAVERFITDGKEASRRDAQRPIDTRADRGGEGPRDFAAARAAARAAGAGYQRDRRGH